MTFKVSKAQFKFTQFLRMQNTKNKQTLTRQNGDHQGASLRCSALGINRFQSIIIINLENVKKIKQNKKSCSSGWKQDISAEEKNM